MRLTEVCFALLDDLGGDHWFLLREPHGWNDETLQLAFDSMLILAASVHMRMVLRFHLFPWRLRFALEGAHMQKATIASELMDSCDECLDAGFSQKIKALVVDDRRADLIEPTGQAHKVVKAAFCRCRVSNVLSEDRFARAGVVGGRRGRALDAASVAARHVLGEHTSQWAVCKASWEQNQKRCPDIVLEGARNHSGWHRFFSQMRTAMPTLSMKEAGQMWADLSDDRRAKFSQEAHDAPAAEKESRRLDGQLPGMPSEETPFELGDHTSPVQERLVEALPRFDSTESLSSQWRKSVDPFISPCNDAKRLVQEESVEMAGGLPMTCGDRYGPGRCKQSLSEDQQRYCKVHTRMLQSLASLHRHRDHCQLYQFVPEGIDGVPGRSALLLLRALSVFGEPPREIYIPCGCDEELGVGVGTEVRLNQRSTLFRQPWGLYDTWLPSTCEVARHMALVSPGAWEVREVSYKIRPVPLRLVVVGSELVDFIAPEKAGRKRLKSGVDHVVNLAQKVFADGDGGRKRSTQRARRGRGVARRVQVGAAQEGAATATSSEPIDRGAQLVAEDSDDASSSDSAVSKDASDEDKLDVKTQAAYDMCAVPSIGAASSDESVSAATSRRVGAVVARPLPVRIGQYKDQATSWGPHRQGGGRFMCSAKSRRHNFAGNNKPTHALASVA